MSGGGMAERLAQARMGIGLESLTKQKLSIMQEAESSGARVICAWDEGAHTPRSTSVRWQALSRGGLEVTSRQSYVLETAGVRHLYVQPFSGDARLPGVHHLWVRGALRSPALYDASRKSFFAGDDQALAAWLQAQPVADAMHEIDWTWMITGQSRAIEPVVFQIRAMRGVGHLAIRAFAPGGVLHSSGPDHHLVGFRGLPRLVHALLAAVGPAEADQPLPVPADGEETFAQMLAGTLEVPAHAAPRDFSEAIHAVLRSGDMSPLALAPLKPKKEAGARKELLPPWLADQPILAMEDRTVFGGGTRGVAFTPTHVCVRTDEGGAGIAYADITAATSMAATLVVRSRVHGDFALGLARPEPFAALFSPASA